MVPVELSPDAFWSNCLIEALKAKARNPKVKLGFYHDLRHFRFHLYWFQDGRYHDFTSAAEPKEPPCTLLFKGRLRSVPQEVWDAWKKKKRRHPVEGLHQRPLQESRPSLP